MYDAHYHRRQAEEAQEIAAVNLAMFRRAIFRQFRFTFDDIDDDDDVNDIDDDIIDDDNDIQESTAAARRSRGKSSTC